MTVTDRVEIDPRVMLGKPVILGTRIPVELLLRKLKDFGQLTYATGHSTSGVVLIR